MNFQLDITTLLYLFIFGNLFIALLVTFYRFYFPKDIASCVFIAAKWVHVLYWSSILLWDVIPRFIGIPLSNGLILAGGFMEIAALLMMMGMFGRKVKLYYLVLIVGSVISFCIIALFFNRPNLRVASTSLWSMFFVILPAYLLTSNKERTPLQSMLGFVFYAFGLSMLGRAFTALFLEPGMGALSANTVQYLYYLGMFFLLIVGTAAFILLSNEHSYKKLKKMATYDTLTGILSRRAFLLEAEVKLTLAVRKQEYYSLLLLDLDHFKEVNDTYGHDKGDKVLQDFAFTIESSLGNDDLFGRVGGEEFAVLLYGLNEEDSGRKAEQLRTAVMDAPKLNLPCGYTVSIGVITVLPTPRTFFNMLYKLSDRALYQAKQQGRNCVVISR
ncbi:GGDEF domain-containing protein [Paenibacillus sp. FSL M7-1046]|uniref:GGDEF domain-containing protein n=1 Tax=Paenibacillus sp. FSL M7-1046 TaxID=2975315 RepID=UPI0030F62652